MDTNDLLRIANDLQRTVNEYESALRRIRDQRGDDRCWRDFEELFRLLPEGYTPSKRDTTIELANCQKFIESIHNPETQYVSPQREISELRDLIIHMYIHCAYEDNGYGQMTTQQKALYDQIWENHKQEQD